MVTASLEIRTSYKQKQSKSSSIPQNLDKLQLCPVRLTSRSIPFDGHADSEPDYLKNRTKKDVIFMKITLANRRKIIIIREETKR